MQCAITDYHLPIHYHPNLRMEELDKARSLFLYKMQKCNNTRKYRGDTLLRSQSEYYYNCKIKNKFTLEELTAPLTEERRANTAATLTLQLKVKYCDKCGSCNKSNRKDRSKDRSKDCSSKKTQPLNSYSLKDDLISSFVSKNSLRETNHSINYLLQDIDYDQLTAQVKTAHPSTENTISLNSADKVEDCSSHKKLFIESLSPSNNNNNNCSTSQVKTRSSHKKLFIKSSSQLLAVERAPSCSLIVSSSKDDEISTLSLSCNSEQAPSSSLPTTSLTTAADTPDLSLHQKDPLLAMTVSVLISRLDQCNSGDFLNSQALVDSSDPAVSSPNQQLLINSPSVVKKNQWSNTSSPITSSPTVSFDNSFSPTVDNEAVNASCAIHPITSLERLSYLYDYASRELFGCEKSETRYPGLLEARRISREALLQARDCESSLIK